MLALLVFGGVLVLLAASHVNPVFFGRTLLAQVGLSVGVLPNPYNTLDAQLNQKQAYLNEEQSYLNAQEAALASTSAAASPLTSPLGWYLLAAIFALFVLVVLNFYFDLRRSRGAEEDKAGGVEGGKMGE